jgi:TRAP transporter TAXI family solute receptor
MFMVIFGLNSAYATTTIDVSLITAGTGGTFYPMGAAMTKIINSNQSSIKVTNESTGGSIENVRLLNSKEAEFALLGGDTAFPASQSKGQFKKLSGNFSGMFSMYPEPVTVAVRADSNIHSIADLNGKAVSIGEPGSGTRKKNISVLNALDIKIIPRNISIAAGARALRNGQIDAAMEWSGLPVPAVLNLSTSKKIRLISFTSDEIKKITNKFHYLYKYTIPSGTYKDVGKSAKTLAVYTEAVARNDVPKKVVYTFVKTLFNHLNAFHAAIKAAKYITPQSAVKNVIPLHPGAKQYFKKIGVLK